MPNDLYPPLPSEQMEFLRTTTNKPLLALNLLAAAVYFFVLAFWFERGNLVLYLVLMAGEVFHLWQVFGYIHTVWQTNYPIAAEKKCFLPVDVFITVAGEPEDIVENTIRAALCMRYPQFRVFVLNDGKVAKKENWKAIETLATRLGAVCITRTEASGAKAGNINHALKRTSSPLVAVFDADQAPLPDFLEKAVDYFADPKMGFVQTPQYYQNHGLNETTKGSWEQQELFFGPICKGKNRLNAVFMCGTNMVIRRKALEEVGGMSEDNIAEDFLTSLFIHKKGWRSVYIPQILACGLAPEDFLSYHNQQFRWARGSLEVVFRYNPLFSKGLSWGQKIQYLASASYYLSGAVVLSNALLPLIFFYTGLIPLNISTMSLAAIFLPYIFLTVVVLRLTSNSAYTFKALSFSMSSFPIHIRAIWAVALRKKTAFAVTAKKKVQGNFLSLIIPHLVYIALATIGIVIAISRQGLDAEVLTNSAWAAFNISIFIPFINAALPRATTSPDSKVISVLPAKNADTPVLVSGQQALEVKNGQNSRTN